MATNNSVNTSLQGQTGTGTFVGATSPTITTPRIAQIQDASSNPIMGFSNTASSPDYWQAAAAATQIELQGVGTSANINLLLRAKGNAGLILVSANPVNPLLIYSGTASQHTTFFNFANTAASRTVTFPDADGTVQLQGQSLGAATATSLTFSPTTNGIVGTTTNDNASAGYVGQFVSSQILISSAVSLTTTVAANITSISLTAGDWDVFGNVCLTSSSTLLLNGFGWISTSSATAPDASLASGMYIAPAVSAQFSFQVPSVRISIATTTTVYLSCSAEFGAGTATGCGGIFARRRR